MAVGKLEAGECDEAAFSFDTDIMKVCGHGTCALASGTVIYAAFESDDISCLLSVSSLFVGTGITI
eukprot:3921104-Pyramimonas_sp.AAC.1